jgi:hypothetical protein
VLSGNLSRRPVRTRPRPPPRSPIRTPVFSVSDE